MWLMTRDQRGLWQAREDLPPRPSAPARAAEGGDAGKTGEGQDGDERGDGREAGETRTGPGTPRGEDGDALHGSPHTGSASLCVWRAARRTHGAVMRAGRDPVWGTGGGGERDRAAHVALC